jgi:hypothetical protein
MYKKRESDISRIQHNTKLLATILKQQIYHDKEEILQIIPVIVTVVLCLFQPKKTTESIPFVRLKTWKNR